MSKKKRNKPEAEKPPAPPVHPAWGRLLVGSMAIVVIVLVMAVSMVALRDSMKAESTNPPAAQSGAVSEAPLKDFKVVNAHDHLFSAKYLPKYFKAADATGVVRTLFVASSEFTLMGRGHDPRKGNAENSMQIIEAAKMYPGKIVPFCTLHPDDPDKVEKLKAYVAAGAKGLKLYTGHSNFYDRPLDVEEMLPVYAYCAETGLPIVWHVGYRNTSQAPLATQFDRVMARYPNLKVIIPHFGVTFFRPHDEWFKKFQDLLDKYPSLYTDTSFGTREILVMGLECVSKDTAVFKAFFQKYSDRILFGTDMVVTGNREKTAAWITSVIHACRDVLEKDKYTFAMAATGSPYATKDSNPEGMLNGLALSDDILRKVYETNFQKLFPEK